MRLPSGANAQPYRTARQVDALELGANLADAILGGKQLIDVLQLLLNQDAILVVGACEVLLIPVIGPQQRLAAHGGVGALVGTEVVPAERYDTPIPRVRGASQV